MISEAAIRQLERAITDNPFNAELFFKLGCVRMEQGNNPDALRHFEKSTSLDNRLTKAHFCCGLTYSLMGSMELAVKEWENMVDEDGDLDLEGCKEADQGKVAMVYDLWSTYCPQGSGIIAHYHAGIAFLALLRIPDALSHLDDVYFANRGLERVAYYRSIALMKLAKNKEAADVLEAGLASRMRDPLMCYQAGVAFVESARSAKGITYLQRAIEYNPRYIKAHMRLASVYFEMAQYDSAISLLQKVIKFIPNHAQASFEMGRCYEKQYRMDEACAAYQQAVKAEPKHKEAQLQLGTVLRNIGKQEQALEHLKAYVELDPQDADGYYAVGSVLASLERHAEAVEAFDTAVLRNPRHSFAYYSLGVSCSKCHEYFQAVSAFEAALAINPKELKARAALGVLHFENKELVRAVREFEEVLLSNPRDAESHYFLGSSWLKLDNLPNAIKEYLAAVKTSGGDVATDTPVSRFYTGLSSMHSGDFDKGLKEFQEAAGYGPKGEEEIGLYSLLQLLAITGISSGRKLKSVQKHADNVEDSLFQFVEAMSKMLDIRDPICTSHSERVALISDHIAKYLKLGAEEESAIHLGALLHDIGKIGLPDDAFFAYGSDGRAEAQALAIYRQHTALAQEQLESIAFPEGVLGVIHSHHEFWNGSGFPDGLKGEAIPLEAQIVGLADYFDRLITRNFNGMRMSPSIAINHIHGVEDKYFHAGIVEALDHVLDELLLVLAAKQ